MIKPILDFLGLFGIKEISLYTSLALIGMSSTNLYLNREKLKIMQWKIIGGLMVGAMIGGVIGNRTLMFLIGKLQQDTIVVIIQSSALIMLLSLTLFLMRKKFSMQLSFRVPLLILIGCLLGFLAAMLSIGGGPINVAVLLFIFGFSMKTSALYSIVMIFFSQLSGFTTVGFTTGFAAYDSSVLVLVFSTGVIGGLIGSKVSGFLSNDMANRVFEYVLFSVIFINVINIIKVL